MSKPAIIMTGKFARPKSNVFGSYIDYMTRSEAVRNMAYNDYSAFINQDKTGAIYSDETENLDDYIDYMANPYKTSHLFTSDQNDLSFDEKNQLKAKFQLAYDNDSVMWQDVFSFDNAWLVEKGFLNPKTHELDEMKIQSATRVGMNRMLKQEGLLTSAIWAASIHYNTDNIHVHVASVEPNPIREKKRFVDRETGEIRLEGKGSRSRKTLRAMKSGFANDLLELIPLYQQIDTLQKSIIKGKRATPFLEIHHVQLVQNLTLLRHKLPAELGYWKAGYAKRFDFEKSLYALVQNFVQDYFSKETQTLKTLFDKIEQEQERAYGDAKGQGDWQQGKWLTLYKRLGNDILNELKNERSGQTKSTQGARLNTQLDKPTSQREEAITKALERLITHAPATRTLKEVATYLEKKRPSPIEKEERVLPEKVLSRQDISTTQTKGFDGTVKQLRQSLLADERRFQPDNMTNLQAFSVKNQIKILKQEPKSTLLFTREKWTYYQFLISPKAQAIFVIDPIKDEQGKLVGFKESSRFDISQVTYSGLIPLEEMMTNIQHEEKLGQKSGVNSKKGGYQEKHMKNFQAQHLSYNLQKIFRRTYQDFLNEQAHRQLAFEQEREI